MELIDSKYTREKYKELGIEFTDWQKATIIWNKPMPHQERLDALKELAKEITDVELKKQILERVSYEEKQLEYIMQNCDNNYVYIVKDEKDECDYGAFFMFETALKQARKYAEENMEEMHIYKIQIVKGTDIPIIRNRDRWNTNLFPEKAKIEERFSDYIDGEVGSVSISRAGDIRCWWSNETTDEEELVMDSFDINRFESRFLKLPYVHKAGMFVKYIPTGELSVLATGKEDWDKFLERVDNGLYVDYFDKSHKVYTLCDEGYWSHDHICPFLLEEVELTSEVIESHTEEYWNAMKALSDYWAGNTSLEQEKLVIDTAKSYANSERKLSELGKKVCTATRIRHILW